MDALSSQATSGYKSVILAAEESTRFFLMLTTAAGTVKPATVLVLGVGVAGLRALATAKRLGAAPPATTCGPVWPTRSVRWVPSGSTSVSRPPARAVTPVNSPSRTRSAAAGTRRRHQGFDVVITTALVPGRPAPRLVTAAAVEGMKPGSVVVDLAGETGGNCELTEPGQTVVKHDVTIASPLNLPPPCPSTRGELYSNLLA